MTIFVDWNISQFLKFKLFLIVIAREMQCQFIRGNREITFAGITQIIDSFIRNNKASWRNIDAYLSVSLSALKEPVLQKSGRAIWQKGRRGLSIHEEMRKSGRKRDVCIRCVCVCVCVKGKELQNATITRDLCSRAQPKNLQMPLATFSRSFTLPPRSPSRCAAAAVMQLQSGISLGERKLRELHCARARSFVSPKFIREDASVPSRKLRSCRRAARVVVAEVKGRRNRGDREVTKVDGGQITDR